MGKSRKPSDDNLNEGGRGNNLEKGISDQLNEAHIPDFQHTPPPPATPPPPTTDSADTPDSGGSADNDG